MNRRGWMPLALLAAAGLQAVLAACSTSTPVLNERQAYLASHPDLDRDRADAIAQGRVEIGMTAAEVRAALGPPLHVKRSMRAGPAGALPVEIWIYPGPVVRPSVMKSAADPEFLMRLEFVTGVLASIREM